MLDSGRLDILASAVREAGRYAAAAQSRVHRSFKDDGSVLTEADTAISHRITRTIRELFPEAAVISEEEETENRSRDWIFILDPIDGTDVYSQGLPSFAVSLGILDSDLVPRGAIIAAPRFGLASEELFIRLDPGSRALMDGEMIAACTGKDTITEVTMGSKGPLELDFSSYRGKIRIFGSTILHILAPAVYPSIEGTVVQKCFAWDIASSHAVLRSQGMDLEREDGTPFRYTERFVFGKEKLDSVLYGGTERGRRLLRSMLPVR